MKIVIAGASGLIGRALISELSKNHTIILFKRCLPLNSLGGSAKEVLWNPMERGEWMKEVDGSDAVINLCGEGIAQKRWTPERKGQLRRSRIESTRAIVEAIGQSKTKPKIFLNASAIGFYGARDEKPLDENSSAGAGFLPELCVEWESEALKAANSGARVVLLRTGVVLSKNGGALSKMLPPFKMFIGGPLGHGHQRMSWIHIDDEVAAIIKCLEDSNIHGAVNLAAPQTVTMNEFAKTLGHIMNRPSFARVPGFILKIILGEMSEMLLTGQHVVASKLTKNGFHFKYTNLEPALKNLLIS